MPKKWPEYLMIAVACLFIGYGTGAVITERKRLITFDKTISLQWSGKESYGGNPCGAHVYVVPHPKGYAVRARIYKSRILPISQDCGDIGYTSTPEEAAEKWAIIRWETDGLHIGTGTNAFFLPRAKIEPHP